MPNYTMNRVLIKNYLNKQEPFADTKTGRSDGNVQSF